MIIRLHERGRGSSARDWEVEVGDDTTVRDLATRLFGAVGEGGLLADGQWFAPGGLIARSGILDGAEVMPTGPDHARHGYSGSGQATGGRAGSWELVVVTGPGAGGRLPLPDGDLVSLLLDPFDGLLIHTGEVESPIAELTIFADMVACTWTAPELTVDGEPLSDEVLRPGAILAAGSTTARLTWTGGPRPGPAVGVPADGQTTVPLHRTARLPRPPSPGAVAPPDMPREPATASPFNWAALGAPLILAGVMFTMTHQATFALMSSLGALIVLFTFVESRLRRRRELRRSVADRQRELAAFSTRLDEARAAERRRRWDVTPAAADCVQAAERLSPALWERGPTDSDFLDAFIAVGTLGGWRPAVERMEQAGSDARQQVARADSLGPVPLTFSVDRGELVTLIGSRPEVLGLVRALICQVCCAQGPAHLRLGLLVEDTTDWEWLKWLPHLRDEVSGALRVEVIDAAQDLERAVDEAVRRLTATPLATGSSGRTAGAADPADRTQAVRILLLVDGPRLRPGSSLTFRRALAADTSAIVVGGPPANLTTTLVEVGADDLVTQHDTRTGKTATGAAPAPLPAADASRCVRMLARLDDPLDADRQPPLPASVRLSALVPFDLARAPDVVADGVAGHWAVRRAPGGLAVPVGLDENGPFEIDIVRHGPHGLIGGATGSGKSELLKMIVAGLAARYPPDEVIIGLFDFKGGTSLQELTALPHCVGLVSDTDLHAAERALRYLKTELLRRERLLLQHAAQKIEQMPRGLPRLIVIIDEFQILADELPDELQTVIDLTKRGRSLGVHLLFATQSPASVRNYDEIKRNTQLRMTLKLLDAEDSIRLIDVADAARFTVPGRGLARIDNRVLAFQAGYPSGPVEIPEEGALRLTPFALLPAPAVSRAGHQPAASRPGTVRSAGSASGRGAPAPGGLVDPQIEGAADWWTGLEPDAERAAGTRPAARSGAGHERAPDRWTEDDPWWEVDDPAPRDPASTAGPAGPTEATRSDLGDRSWLWRGNEWLNAERSTPVGVRHVAEPGSPPRDRWLAPAGSHPDSATAEHTELTALIAGVRLAYQAARQRGELQPVADVWPPALPESLELDEIIDQVQAGNDLTGPSDGIRAYFARGDRPDESEHDRQPAVAWHLDAGNALIFGAPGSGASTTLTVLATSLAATMSPTELHLYVLDYAGGDLRELAAMPHCAGNVILGDELERQVNLFAYLRARAARIGTLSPARRAAEAQSILLIDNLTGFINAHETTRSKQGAAVLEDFVAVFGAGPATKVAVAASVAGTRVRAEVAARAPQRLILRLPDRNAYADLNIARGAIPQGTPGRGLWTTGNDLQMEVQVAAPDIGRLRTHQPSRPRTEPADEDAARLPSLIRALPTSVERGELTAAGGARLDGPALLIPIGLGTDTGAVVQVCLQLAEDSPTLIYGPPKCGKSSLLRRLAELTRESLGNTVAIYAAAPAGSPLAGCQVADRVREDAEAAVTLATRAAAENRPALLLIDDVNRLGDSLNTFLQDRHPQLRLVAAARTGELRSADYTSTASRLKAAQTKLVLEPEPGESDPVSGRYFTYPPSGPGRGRGFLISATGTRFVQT